MGSQSSMSDREGLLTLFGLIAVVAVLYFAKVVILPVAMAVMLTFLLAPLVLKLQRIGLPRVVAIITTVVIAFLAIAAIAWTISVQVVSLADELPRYEQTLRSKIRQLNDSHNAEGPLSRAGELVSKLRKELDGGDLPDLPGRQADTGAEVAEPVPAPVTVQLQPESSGVVESAAQVIGPLVGPLGTTGLVGIFVIAMLFQREDLRERFVRIISGAGLNVATEAIDDAAKRISRYLTMQLLVNALYGIPIGIGLHLIGVPNAMLWGFLAILLRFIPYLGPWIAAVFPLALAFAIDPGWSMLFMTLGLFLTLELVSNNIIEPWLYGVSTGISNFALMVAAVFWTWLWGPVGLFLSTPLTVCLVVLGNYVPSLNFFSVLLGSVPALQPFERLYQRMLAMDYNEMLLLSQDFVKEHSLTEYCDQALIPALNAAEADRHAGGLAEIRQTFILQNVPELFEDLVKNDRPELSLLEGAARVLIVPAKDDMDELAAKTLAAVLVSVGIQVRIHAATDLTAVCAERVMQQPFEVVCISAVPPAAFIPARQLYRRISAACPGVKCIIGIWSPTAESYNLQKRLSKNTEAQVVTSFQAAVTQIQSLVSPSENDSMVSAPIPSNEPERLQEVYNLNLVSKDPNELFDSVTRALAKAFNVPISLVSIIDSERQFWKAQTGLPEDLALARESPRDTSVCGHVVAQNSPLVVEDIALDKRFSNNAFLKSRGIRFYAGVPLRSKAGLAVGSLCVIDTKPRNVSEQELAFLTALAELLTESLDDVKCVA
ncbi:MAG: phytochrome sensor protein [unclassified Hahellaceae]|nr:phytochrome sensor protein [Hahellaceae bacterium]